MKATSWVTGVGVTRKTRPLVRTHPKYPKNPSVLKAAAYNRQLRRAPFRCMYIRRGGSRKNGKSLTKAPNPRAADDMRGRFDISSRKLREMRKTHTTSGNPKSSTLKKENGFRNQANPIKRPSTDDFIFLPIRKSTIVVARSKRNTGMRNSKDNSARLGTEPNDAVDAHESR
jgi:hypothetical protein